MANNLAAVKHAKTRKGKLILQKREPQLVEDTKHVAFIRGSTANEAILQVLKDINKIKKPYGVLLNKKNDIKPFEDQPKVEFLCDKNDCPLFAFASHNKKRPLNLTLGRTFDGQILDMFEFGVENYKKMDEFKNSKTSMSPKPILMFAGDAFETQHEYIRMKNLFIDFFSGQKTDGIRYFKVLLMKSGSRTPRVELEEIGPRFDLALRRNQLASEDLFKRSLKQPYQLKPKPTKNVNTTPLGTTYGRVHMERQDYSKLTTKSMRVPKRLADGNEDALDRLNRLNPIKKSRKR